MSKISVRFLINKEQKRVVCAEAGSDFVDVLFSFLTLPLGSIVRLLGKQSGFGSLDSLYEGVEQLDDKHLQTEACKEMLLKPRSAAAEICEDLKIKNIHDDNPRHCYICNESDCLTQSTCYYTYLTKARCSRCGKPMTKSWLWPKKKSDEGGIFVHETTNFMITDDLRVMPTSLMGGCSLLNELRVTDASALEEMIIDFSTKESLNLLRRSLVSKNPLTEICFPDACVQTSVNYPLAIKEEIDVNQAESEITLKLVLNKKNNNVLYAEVGEHFVNQLLSFLTFPLGSVLKLLSDNRSTLGGCISNLYSSVESMGLDYFKSENCRDVLLSPKLATFYGFEKQILKLEEITSHKLSVPRCCIKCYYDYDKREYPYCNHLARQTRQSELIEQNSKVEKIVTDIGGFFVVDSRKFMITDNLHISSLSFISAIGNEMNFPISDLVGKDVCVDKAKVLSMLSVMLISKTVLTDVFCPKPMRSKRNYFSKIIQSLWYKYFIDGLLAND